MYHCWELLYVICAVLMIWLKGELLCLFCIKDSGHTYQLRCTNDHCFEIRHGRAIDCFGFNIVMRITLKLHGRLLIHFSKQ